MLSFHPNFKLSSVSGQVIAPSDLGPLADLVGTWRATDFKIRFGDHSVSQEQDRFLEFNETGRDRRHTRPMPRERWMERR
jgi:hypothetical protein